MTCSHNNTHIRHWTIIYDQTIVGISSCTSCDNERLPPQHFFVNLPESEAFKMILFKAAKSTWLFLIARSSRLPFSSSSRIFDTLIKFSGKSSGLEPNLCTFLMELPFLGNWRDLLNRLIRRHSQGSKSSSEIFSPLIWGPFEPGERSSFEILFPRDEVKLSRLELWDTRGVYLNYYE